MTDGEAILRTILDNPDDDAPRLVYADWLDEHGQEEAAEFIRVQVELARSPRWEYAECKVCGATPNEEGYINHGRGCYVLDSDGGGSEGAAETERYIELSTRERELLNAGWRRLAPDFPLLMTNGFLDIIAGHANVTFHRGFVERITCTASDWLAHADAIRAAHPVRAVTLTAWPEIATWYDESESSTHPAPVLRSLGVMYPGIEFMLPETLVPFAYTHHYRNRHRWARPSSM